MDSRDSKRKRKTVLSKLTKLSLKKNTQELKSAEDSFDGFGSFAFSLRSYKEVDGTISSSGEEKSNFLSRNIIDLLPSGDEVRNFSQSQTQSSQYNSLLENSIHCKTSCELSDIHHLKETGDSDESFAENFETPSKEKQCSDNSRGHEQIRIEEVGVNDVSLVSKVENDHIICLNSPQTVSENNSDNNALLTKSNNCCVETDSNFSVLSSSNTFTVDCVTTECGKDNVYGTVNGIIINSVLEEKTTVNLLVTESKQTQESIGVLKSEVTSSSAEHIDVCVLQENTSRDAEKVHDADDDQLSPYFSASDLTCPLCWKKFDKKSTHTAHMKSCAVSHNVTTKQLLDALALQSKQAAERKALGLPEAPIVTAQGTTRKNVSRKGTGVPKDQNLQLALALSVSMKEAEQLELEKEEDALIEAGLGEEVMERQKSLLEKFGFTSSKPPSLEPANPRAAGPKKVKSSVPVLITRSREERERLITEKVAIILMGKEDETETSQVTEKLSDSKCRKLTLSSKYLHKFLDKASYLWRKAQVPPEGIHRNSYYVSYLDTFITPSTVVTGSQLKDISKIPCREETPVRDSLRTADTNQEDNFQQSDLKLVKYIPESPSASLDSEEELHISYDDNEKKDVSSVSLSSPTSLTKSFVSFGKDSILQNWKMQINNKTMSDVTVHVKGSLEIAAHKLVFFAQAPSILCDISEKSGEEVGHLHWKDVSFNSGLAFLHYIYCGSIEEICSLQEGLNDIRSLAVRYNMSELINHLDKLQHMDSSNLKCLNEECFNSKIEEKHNSSKPGTTSKMSDRFHSHTELDVEESVDTPQQQNQQHCKEIGKCEDSASSSFCDIDYTEYGSDPHRSEEMLMKSQINENDDKSDRSSPDIFSEPHTPSKTNDIQRDNIDILSSMLCKLTSSHEPTDVYDSITDAHEDSNSVCDLTQSPQDLSSDHEPAKIEEVEDDSLTGMQEDANIHRNVTPGTPEAHNSVNFAGVITATPTSAKRKLADALLTPSKCNSPAKKIRKERDSSPLQTEGINQNQFLNIPTDSFIDTIDLTQNSDGSHENEACQQNCAESTSTGRNNQPDSAAIKIVSSHHTLPLSSPEIQSFEIEKSDKEIQYNLVNCPDEPNQVNGYNSPTISENRENTLLPTSPLELCRTEESPEYEITTFTSPKSTLKPVNQLTKEMCTDSPLSETPLALRCLSKFSDVTVRRSLSQIMSHLVDQDTQSLILALDKVESKQISPGVTSTNSSDTPKTLKQTAVDSLKMMLEDSFVDQIRDNSFFREEFLNTPSGSCRTEANDNINNENSGTPEHQSITPGNKSSISEALTPLPDYSTMKTPQLKKELQKYGLKPLKRKQAKLILRHIYNELHPWVPANGTETTQAASSPISLIMEKNKGRENIAKQINCDLNAPKTRSPRKRNIQKCFSDSSKACSSYRKENSDDECDSEMFPESNHNANDYSILLDDEEVFQEQSVTSENRSECSQQVDLQTAVQNFIINNPEIHEKILVYEPVWLNDLKNGLKANKVKFKMDDLMDYLDEQCITYRTAAGPHKSRQKKKGGTVSQSQNIGRKKRTTEEDCDPLPSSSY